MLVSSQDQLMPQFAAIHYAVRKELDKTAKTPTTTTTSTTTATPTSTSFTSVVTSTLLAPTATATTACASAPIERDLQQPAALPSPTQVIKIFLTTKNQVAPKGLFDHLLIGRPSVKR